jgi:pimeloyl-ACP methyl ester carboxylesterase
MNPPMEGFYDRGLAARLARGAAAAYGAERDIQAWAQAQECAACEVVRDERADTLAFVAAAGETGFVIFRGTRDLRNWITDLDCRRVEFSLQPSAFSLSGAEVHEGFSRALRNVWADLSGALKQMAPGCRNVFFAGHSLGGALAMLAAAGFQCGAQGTERPTVWVYTFGQPRVGNGVWAAWYDRQLGRRSFRVVHAEDVVARVPWLLGRYRHCGTEVFYDTAGVCHLDRKWWEKALSDAAGLCREWKHGAIALLGDHHVGTYVQILNADNFAAVLDRRCMANGI